MKLRMFTKLCLLVICVSFFSNCKSEQISVPNPVLSQQLNIENTNNKPLSITGEWLTFDSKTNVKDAIVHVYEVNGMYFGKIKKTLQDKDKGIVCYMCRGEDKDKPVEGLVILKNMSEESENEYSGGTILDPWSGNTYDCDIELQNNGNTLQVRGFIGFSLFGRTEIWQRVDDAENPIIK